MIENEALKIISIDDITKDNICELETFIWLYDRPDEVSKQRDINLLIEMAAGWRMKKQFDDMHRAFKKDLEAERKKDAQENGNRTGFAQKTNFFDGEEKPPYRELNCGSWVADKNGIYNYTANGPIMASYQPVTIVSQLVNVETGEEKVKIAFKKNKRWKEITPNKDVIASANKIVALSNAGLGVTSETAKQLVKYLADLEGLNQGVIPVEHSTGKLGWNFHDREIYFTPYDDFMKFDGESRFANIYHTIKQHGSREKWLQLAKEIRAAGRLEPRIMLASSFASALVKLCNALPFFVHLHGPSEGGKTLCLMLAASVWANPDANGDYFGNFMTTQAATEARADVLNNFPYIVDDTAKTSKRLNNDFSELIYTLCSGTGKDRSNQNLGLRRMNNWHNVILTSGENPITDSSAQAGAINRVIEVTAGYERIFSDGFKIAETLKENYGFAGKEFVEAIKCMHKLDNKSVSAMQAAFLQEINSKEKMQKQAISMSVILTADQLATDFIFLDGKSLTVDEVDEFIKSESEVSENERCLEFINGEVMRNINKFVTNSNECENTDIMGRFADEIDVKTGERESRVYIIANAFDQMCKAGNFSAGSFRRWASVKGISKHRQGKLTDFKRIKRYEKALNVINLPWKLESENEFMENE